jgi:putative transposase
MAEYWLDIKTVETLGIPLRTIQRHCASGKYTVRTVPSRGKKGEKYEIEISSLSPAAQMRFWESSQGCTIMSTAGYDQVQLEAELYASLNDWQREWIDRFRLIYQLTKGMRGAELKSFLNIREQSNPGQSWSYQNWRTIYNKYEKGGLMAIVPQWGKRKSTVPDIYQERFNAEFLKQGAPSVESCWKQVLGFFSRTEKDFDIKKFPSAKAFERRLLKEMPESSAFLLRHGPAKWNRKYGYSIERDYSKLKAGEVWVSDHAQLDVAAEMPDGKLRYLWVTVWADVKTGKWLGWCIHEEGPNSDHIFLAFYRAAAKYGIPSDIIIDNGKDYRCKSFTGGRDWWKLEIDEQYTNSLVQSLHIIPHFAWPYNAQSKIIERTFRKVNQGFSCHLAGYRGPDIPRKPEALVDQKSAGQIWKRDKLVSEFDKFITEVYNRDSSDGKVLQGMCPDELWEKEYPQSIDQACVRLINKDALALFCMRNSEPVEIRRGKAKDSKNGIFYYAPWMITAQGTKVYWRADPEDRSVAWFFEAESNKYMGKAVIDGCAPALARTDDERLTLAAQIQRKQQVAKVTAAYAKVDSTTNDDHTDNRIAAINLLNAKRGYVPSEPMAEHGTFVATRMDKVMAEERKRQAAGSFDFGQFADVPSEEKKESDLDLWGESAIAM